MVELLENWLGESFMVRDAAKVVAIGVLLAGTLMAESRKEYRFSVGPKAGVSVVNPYGSISVKPSLNNTVIVNAVLHSDKVEVDNSQNGNRVVARGRSQLRNRPVPKGTP